MGAANLGKLAEAVGSAADTPALASLGLEEEGARWLRQNLIDLGESCSFSMFCVLLSRARALQQQATADEAAAAPSVAGASGQLSIATTPRPGRQRGGQLTLATTRVQRLMIATSVEATGLAHQAGGFGAAIRTAAVGAAVHPLRTGVGNSPGGGGASLQTLKAEGSVAWLSTVEEAGAERTRELKVCELKETFARRATAVAFTMRLQGLATASRSAGPVTEGEGDAVVSLATLGLGGDIGSESGAVKS